MEILLSNALNSLWVFYLTIFSLHSYYPNVVGALDNCHLKVQLFEEDHINYYNYKNFHSIHLLAIALPDLRFTFVHAGHPGRYDLHNFKV